LLYLFEDYGLDTDRRQLYRATSLVSVEPKVFDLLAYVIRNREHVVSKDDLIATIWNGRIVSESALTTCINAARTAIGDSGEAQRLIKTLPRKGIRFVGIVREEEGKPAAVAPTVTIPEPLHRSSTLPDKPSIAVLPFANISGDPEQEYFSDGITEDIITDLSKISALEVVSRNTVFTFKGKAVDIGEIASRLKVGHVVEGSVRKAGGRVRITAELIDAGNDRHVWAERYDRELRDIFALQDEISQAIVAALKGKLLLEEKRAIETRSTQNPEAYQLYLLARYYHTQYGARTLKIAHRFCLRALEIDPNYARAWALAAWCETILYFFGKHHESGLLAAERALSLDPTLAEAHAAKAQALHQLGRNVEAIAAHEESLRLEPESFDVRMSFAVTCMRLGRSKEAIEHYERAAQLVESEYSCLSLAAGCHRWLGRHEECESVARRALARVEREIAVRPDNGHAMTIGAIVLAYLGETERAKEWASRAMTIESEEEQNNYELACAFALANEVDRALDQLERYADEMPAERVNWVKRDGDLTRLHDHPRFQALVKRSEARLAAVQSEHAPKVG
jgi:adenylate cyclase